MRRVILVVAAAVIGCQANPPPGKSAAGKRQRAAKAAPAETGGRFFARGIGGETYELELRKLAVDVATGPGTVRSHLSMEVATRAGVQAEAVIRLPVPRGAAVTDAVLWVNDKPMRGAFVERQRAASIYTSIVTRRRDPALVAWDGPGWIAVSIFPLENKQSRRFELEWVEPAAIAGGRIQYRVPFVAERERVVGRASVNVDGRRVAGDTGELIAIAPADAYRAFTRRAPGDPFQQVMVRDSDAAGTPHFVLVVETSEAMRPYRSRQRAMLDALIGELPEDAKLTMLAADWDVSPIVEAADAAAWPDALAKLDTIPSAGALHLERVLREAAASARKNGAGAVLFFGIGLDGFRVDAVVAPLAELRDANVRLSVVEQIVGFATPPALLRAAAETGGEAIDAAAFDDSLPGLVDALRPHPAQPALDGRGDGEWHRLRTVTGDNVWIGRALDPQTPAGDETARVDAGSPLAADLASLWDRARLEWHDRDAADEAPKVLTPVTSLLVLETEQDYQRFGLAVPEPFALEQGGRGKRHKAEESKMGKRTTASRDGLYGLRGPHNPDPQLAPRLAEEQARNAGSLGVLKLAEGSPIASIFGRDTALGNDAQDVLGGLSGNQIGEASGVGGLGVVGTGSGGGATAEGSTGLGNLGTIGKAAADGGNGSGHGRGAGGLSGKSVMASDVIPGQANVRGNLDKEVVRRIIRRHINEVRYCYDLLKQPSLGGRVMVQFTIAPSGQVIASVLQSSTLGSARVESCIVSAVRRWEFPHPLGGGIVIVSYPFVLTPRGGRERVAIAPDEPPAPRPIDEALATLAKGGDAANIEKIASLLGLRRISSAEALAWMIDRRSGPLVETHLLVARLLEQAKRHRDAVRVLSEAAAQAPQAVAAELRALKSDADADEVVRLASR
jgi:TonB family protein